MKNRMGRKVLGMAAAFGLATMMVGCEEALQDELGIDSEPKTEVVDTVTDTDQFMNDALAKYGAIETAQNELFDVMMKFTDPNAFDNPDIVAEANSALDNFDATSQVELLSVPENTSAGTSATYFEVYKEQAAEYSSLIRDGINNIDAQKILDANSVQDEMMGAYGITVKSLVIAIEGK